MCKGSYGHVICAGQVDRLAKNPIFWQHKHNMTILCLDRKNPIYSTVVCHTEVTLKVYTLLTLKISELRNCKSITYHSLLMEAISPDLRKTKRAESEGRWRAVSETVWPACSREWEKTE